MNGIVGIITRTKNRPTLLKRAIESVLNQSYEQWIMVIVNDGGDPVIVDRLAAHYESRARGRIKIIHNEQSLGMEAASNRGIRAISPDYFVIHDDDDSWSPEFLKIGVAELEHAHQQHSRINGVITMANAIFERIEGNTVIVERVEEYKPWINKGVISLDTMLSDNQFAPIQFIYRAEVIEKIGLYREDLPVLGDWEFNIRFMLRYDIMVIPQVLAFYHHRGHDSNGIYGNSIIAARDKHDFFRQFLKNEWLRNDISSGSASLGHFVNIRPQLNHTHWIVSERIDKRIDQLFSRQDDIVNRITSIEIGRHPIYNFLALFSLWSKSEKPIHYIEQFFMSLLRKGPGETMRTVKLWYNIKRKRSNQH